MCGKFKPKRKPSKAKLDSAMRHWQLIACRNECKRLGLIVLTKEEAWDLANGKVYSATKVYEANQSIRAQLAAIEKEGK